MDLTLPTIKVGVQFRIKSDTSVGFRPAESVYTAVIPDGGITAITSNYVSEMCDVLSIGTDNTTYGITFVGGQLKHVVTGYAFTVGDVGKYIIYPCGERAQVISYESERSVIVDISRDISFTKLMIMDVAPQQLLDKTASTSATATKWGAHAHPVRVYDNTTKTFTHNTYRYMAVPIPSGMTTLGEIGIAQTAMGDDLFARATMEEPLDISQLTTLHIEVTIIREIDCAEYTIPNMGLDNTANVQFGAKMKYNIEALDPELLLSSRSSTGAVVPPRMPGNILEPGSNDVISNSKVYTVHSETMGDVVAGQLDAFKELADKQFASDIKYIASISNNKYIVITENNINTIGITTEGTLQILNVSAHNISTNIYDVMEATYRYYQSYNHITKDLTLGIFINTDDGVYFYKDNHYYGYVEESFRSDIGGANKFAPRLRYGDPNGIYVIDANNVLYTWSYNVSVVNGYPGNIEESYVPSYANNYPNGSKFISGYYGMRCGISYDGKLWMHLYGTASPNDITIANHTRVTKILAVSGSSMLVRYDTGLVEIYRIEITDHYYHSNKKLVLVASSTTINDIIVRYDSGRIALINDKSIISLKDTTFNIVDTDMPVSQYMTVNRGNLLSATASDRVSLYAIQDYVMTETDLPLEYATVEKCVYSTSNINTSIIPEHLHSIHMGVTEGSKYRSIFRISSMPKQPSHLQKLTSFKYTAKIGRII